MVLVGEVEAEWSHPGWASSPAWNLNPMDINLSKLWERAEDREVHATVHGVSNRHDFTTQQQQQMEKYITLMVWKTTIV